MKNLKLVFQFILNLFINAGNKISVFEKKFLSSKGVATFASILVISTMLMSCEEKLKSPISSTSIASVYDSASASISSSDIANSAVSHISSVKDTLEKKVIDISNPSISAPTIEKTSIAAPIDTVSSSDDGTIEVEKKITVKKAVTVNKSSPAAKTSIGSSFKSFSKNGATKFSYSNIKSNYRCPCENEVKVSTPQQTLSFFSRQTGLSVQELSRINKPQAFTDKAKTHIKKNIRFCLKRRNC